MLTTDEADELARIAREDTTPPMARVSALALCHRVSAIPAREITSLLRGIVSDSRAKSAVKVKALDLIDKVSNCSKTEPELSSEDAERVKIRLMEKFVVCPKQA